MGACLTASLQARNSLNPALFTFTVTLPNREKELRELRGEMGMGVRVRGIKKGQRETERE